MNVLTRLSKDWSVRLTVLLFLVSVPMLLQADRLEEGRAAIGAGNYARAHELLGPLAEAGDATAQNAMGVLYIQGWGVVADPERAAEYFQSSAEQGNIKGTMNLADAYRTGMGVEQNCAKARDLLAPIAHDGIAKAQVVLGSIYDSGCPGFPPDPKRAFQWYSAAAEQDDPYGLGNTAAMYALGRGVDQNYPEAMRLYRVAAELGNGKAAYNLGRMYELGQGMPPDPEQAKQWYRKAASMGEVEAEQRLNALEYPGTSGRTINEELLAEALKAPSIELAESYGSISNVIKMLPLAEAGVTVQLPDGEVNKSNVAAVRIELEQRMAAYARAIDQRGVADLRGEYTAIARDCGDSGSAWAMAIAEGYDRIFLEQNGSEVKFAASKKKRRSSNDIVAKGFCVETAFALIDPMNSDYVLVGESRNGRITISPDAESVLNAWPDFIQPPSRSSLSSCVVTLTPPQ
jgi:TPR repeat protein